MEIRTPQMQQFEQSQSWSQSQFEASGSIVSMSISGGDPARALPQMQGAHQPGAQRMNTPMQAQNPMRQTPLQASGNVMSLSISGGSAAHGAPQDAPSFPPENQGRSLIANALRQNQLPPNSQNEASTLANFYNPDYENHERIELAFFMTNPQDDPAVKKELIPGDVDRFGNPIRHPTR